MATLMPLKELMPDEFIKRLLFMTRREAQRLLDRYYPGWYIRVAPDGTASIYNPARILVCKIGRNHR